MKKKGIQNIYITNRNKKNSQKLVDEIGGSLIEYKDNKNIPRPKHWSGWCLNPTAIEFWLGDEYRIHERLKYNKILKQRIISILIKF